jgi:hypothetical protein
MARHNTSLFDLRLLCLMSDAKLRWLYEAPFQPFLAESLDILDEDIASLLLVFVLWQLGMRPKNLEGSSS